MSTQLSRRTVSMTQRGYVKCASVFPPSTLAVLFPFTIWLKQPGINFATAYYFHTSFYITRRANEILILYFSRRGLLHSKSSLLSSFPSQLSTTGDWKLAREKKTWQFCKNIFKTWGLPSLGSIIEWQAPFALLELRWHFSYGFYSSIDGFE